MYAPLTSEQLDTALLRVQRHLLGLRNADGYWQGHLSSSALANAVAAFALSCVDAGRHRRTIERALQWLAAHVNPDGGWGDTVGSPSNISATILCWSALRALDHERAPSSLALLDGAERWLSAKARSLDPDDLVRAVRTRYGRDETFSVPILAMCAMAGSLGPDGFSKVPQLPFELATAPPSLYRRFRFSVVSYAMPALLAIGRLVHRRRPAVNPAMRCLRDCLTSRALRMVHGMQPTHGGFQDSAVLTGFVVMGLAGAGHTDHEVVRQGEAFLVSHMREDGSWPVDTNLSLWLSSLAVRALTTSRHETAIPGDLATRLKTWFLSNQHTRVHPMTHAPPGGWGWTDEPGSIPDGDDTASVLIALPALGPIGERTRAASERGLAWLVGLQNADGGIPAFCRGWGRLPFDRSCPTMTASFLLAADTWRPHVSQRIEAVLARPTANAVRFLRDTQAGNGSWTSLWFGNQWAPEQRNAVYGTARTVLSLRARSGAPTSAVRAMIDQGCEFLAGAQNPDGSWSGHRGGPGSIEETALSVSALAGTNRSAAVMLAVTWLLARTGAGVSDTSELRFPRADRALLRPPLVSRRSLPGDLHGRGARARR